jgi:arylsulfatase A-like enzyme
LDDLLRSAATPLQDRALRDARTDFDRVLTRKVLGGYVALLDDGLGRLLDAADQASTSESTLFVVTAAHGLAVHEAGVLRDEWEPASDELVHVPLMIRPAGSNHGVRRQSVSQSVDLAPTLLEWFGLELPQSAFDGQTLWPTIRGQQAEPRRLAFAADERSITSVRTPDYYLVQSSAEEGSEPARRLFAKPEDAWEVNDLATQLPGVVDELAGDCDRFFGERPRQSGR